MNPKRPGRRGWRPRRGDLLITAACGAGGLIVGVAVANGSAHPGNSTDAAVFGLIIGAAFGGAWLGLVRFVSRPRTRVAKAAAGDPLADLPSTAGIRATGERLPGGSDVGSLGCFILSALVLGIAALLRVSPWLVWLGLLAAGIGVVGMVVVIARIRGPRPGTEARRAKAEQFAPRLREHLDRLASEHPPAEVREFQLRAGSSLALIPNRADCPVVLCVLWPGGGGADLAIGRWGMPGLEDCPVDADDVLPILDAVVAGRYRERVWRDARSGKPIIVTAASQDTAGQWHLLSGRGRRRRRGAVADETVYPSWEGSPQAPAVG